ISERIYNQNPEEILPLEKIQLDDIFEFSGTSELSSFHKNLKLDSELNYIESGIEKKIPVFTQKSCTPLSDLSTLSKEQILLFSKNLATVLFTSHSLDIVHGDIKPDNIVYDDKKAYLIDWEGALKIDDLEELPTSFDHTDRYVIQEEDHKCFEIAQKFNRLKKIAPNSLQLKTLKQEYLTLRKQIDIFELGITLYQLACKSKESFPFEGTYKQTDRERERPILELKSVNDRINTEELIGIYTLEQISYLKQMLHPNPEVRPSMEEVLAFF
ncbi:MAG: phosphotransferase, partial [Verrucomicrobia bacterium]|nr:phosphotransferase [Verrucomicrobiota bacterium]